jgi:hypothetical protein
VPFYQRQCKNSFLSASLCRALWYTYMTTATLGLIGASKESDAAISTKSIEVDRQVLLNDVAGKPTAIIRKSDGTLIVAGVRGTAWALGANADGDILWQFEYPREKAARTEYQSKFNGAVSLENDRVLFCGEKTTQGSIGLITILDNNGHVVEERTGEPNSDAAMTSGITHCVHWNDGVALIGWSSNGNQGSPWITKLDINGAMLWSKRIPDLPAGDLVETADHCLVLATFNGVTFEVELAKVNGKGEVVARRAIKARDFILLHSVVPSKTVTVLTYGDGTALTMHRLNDRLEEAAKALDIGSFDAMQGRGYILADNSVVLFGRTDTAAIAWIRDTGRLLALKEIDRKYKSYVISDAVPLSGGQFVTVQESVMQNHGLVMTWAKFKSN